jgi:hypothetical protein
MRRIARHLFALCSAASLALGTACCVRPPPDWVRDVGRPVRFDGARALATNSAGPDALPGLRVTSYYRHSNFTTMQYQLRVSVVAGEVAFGALVLPVTWSVSRVRERRRFRRLDLIRRKLCLVCGYDLRASAERCPECGTSRSVA